MLLGHHTTGPFQSDDEVRVPLKRASNSKKLVVCQHQKKNLKRTIGSLASPSRIIRAKKRKWGQPIFVMRASSAAPARFHAAPLRRCACRARFPAPIRPPRRFARQPHRRQRRRAASDRCPAAFLVRADPIPPTQSTGVAVVPPLECLRQHHAHPIGQLHPPSLLHP
jgi:hypothetical protein